MTGDVGVEDNKMSARGSQGVKTVEKYRYKDSEDEVSFPGCRRIVEIYFIIRS